MEKTILLLLMGDRTDTAVQVQKILTNMGCAIKTRLGIHDVNKNECANTGLLILELVGDADQKRKLADDLRQVHDVKVELVEMSL